MTDEGRATKQTFIGADDTTPNIEYAPDQYQRNDHPEDARVDFSGAEKLFDRSLLFESRALAGACGIGQFCLPYTADLRGLI